MQFWPTSGRFFAAITLCACSGSMDGSAPQGGRSSQVGGSAGQRDSGSAGAPSGGNTGGRFNNGGESNANGGMAGGTMGGNDAGGAAGTQSNGGADAQGGEAGDNGDAGQGGNAGVGGNAPPADLVPMFVAQGRGGRTITSCDDGRTWIADRNVNGSNDDHDPWAAQNIVNGDGVFVASYGWYGNAQTHTIKTLRSEDGINWQQTFDQGQRSGQGSVVFGDGKFVVISAYGGSGNYYVSSDGGMTWQSEELGIYIEEHMRSGISVDGLIMTGGDQGAAILGPDPDNLRYVSRTGCSTGFGRLAGNDNVLLAWGGGIGNYTHCRSTDGGATWQSRASEWHAGTLVWTGVEFYHSHVREVSRSADGITWTKTDTTGTDGTWISAVARSPEGTYVGIDHEGDQFFRSTNGVNWTKVQDSPGPLIRHIIHGYAKPSAMCPGSG